MSPIRAAWTRIAALAAAVQPPGVGGLHVAHASSPATSRTRSSRLARRTTSSLPRSASRRCGSRSTRCAITRGGSRSTRGRRSRSARRAAARPTAADAHRPPGAREGGDARAPPQGEAVQRAERRRLVRNVDAQLPRAVGVRRRPALRAVDFDEGTAQHLRRLPGSSDARAAHRRPLPQPAAVDTARARLRRAAAAAPSSTAPAPAARAPAAPPPPADRGRCRRVRRPAPAPATRLVARRRRTSASRKAEGRSPTRARGGRVADASDVGGGLRRRGRPVARASMGVACTFTTRWRRRRRRRARRPGGGGGRRIARRRRRARASSGAGGAEAAAAARSAAADAHRSRSTRNVSSCRRRRAAAAGAVVEPTPARRRSSSGSRSPALAAPVPPPHRRRAAASCFFAPTTAMPPRPAQSARRVCLHGEAAGRVSRERELHDRRRRRPTRGARVRRRSYEASHGAAPPDAASVMEADTCEAPGAPRRRVAHALTSSTRPRSACRCPHRRAARRRGRGRCGERALAVCRTPTAVCTMTRRCGTLSTPPPPAQRLRCTSVEPGAWDGDVSARAPPPPCRALGRGAAAVARVVLSPRGQCSAPPAPPPPRPLYAAVRHRTLRSRCGDRAGSRRAGVRRARPRAAARRARRRRRTPTPMAARRRPRGSLSDIEVGSAGCSSAAAAARARPPAG